MTMSEYLALKAVSAGVLKTLLDECPAAAWWDSPWNPNRPSFDTDASDAGSVIHAILLEGSTDCVAVLDPADYPGLTKPHNIPEGFTNKPIREARDAARAAGKIPMLKADFSNVVGAVHSAHNYIASTANSEPAVFRAFRPDGGISEETFLFDIDGVQCKIRPDRIDNDRNTVVDVKTTKGSADPETWGRAKMIGEGDYLSAALYQRGMELASGIVPTYIFLVVQQEPPYLCSMVGCDPPTLDLGHRKVSSALATWKRCAAGNHWPGYSNRVAYPALPQWEVMRFEEREVMDLELGGQGD